MSKQASTADAVKGKNLTTGDESYLQTGWQKGLDSADNFTLTELVAIGGEINSVVEAAAKTVAHAQIKVGQLLTEAREFFKGDNEFGKWRAECTHVGSKQHAHSLMKLAQAESVGKFSDQMIEKLPPSTLIEMIPASKELMKEFAEKVASGEKPTVKETRAAVKGEKRPNVLDPKEDNRKHVQHLSKKTQSPEERANEILSLHLSERLVRLDFANINDCWLAFGIPPFMDGTPSKEVIVTLHKSWKQDLGPIQADQLTAAYESLLKEFY